MTEVGIIQLMLEDLRAGLELETVWQLYSDSTPQRDMSWINNLILECREAAERAFNEHP